ncbi:MAG TPA: hypothetical protein VK510_08535, partial [Solirubrobacteraceae bacterium]|nr:hypothetical protein [Solirubrobacteraceae bacterium]
MAIGGMERAMAGARVLLRCLLLVGAFGALACASARAEEVAVLGNVNVSVRVDSPGDEGAVVQAAPGNVNVSVRVDSPGDDGPVTQTGAAPTPSGAAPTPA